ncbi:DNA polymerase-3 subunit epsilon [Klenkia soli]|uniref:DNA polymerase-3 subunit epsilon n=1 Tax=Klenkia soli TaxID=1052260 RepID=A0A1H0KLS9_9ACTN|nr:TerD family protein [Klenkia soli]SDO56878.1 DNA polymerase-3 subunit epsilon [Klenkia soli]
MTGVFSSAVLPAEVASRYPYGYALVDVETSGLRATSDRVLQIAVTQMAADGAIESTWSTLLDPGCDPGPTHIHGLTRAKLRGAPQYCDVADDVGRRVGGRVIVAHNVDFDHRFLAAEATRAGRRLLVDQRLCTLALTRRLDVPVLDFKLGSVAAYWGVRAVRAHDAADDVRVLTEILRHSLVTAARLDMDLPLAACIDAVPAPYPPKAPRTPCPWRAPHRWVPGAPLVQGMKVVISGATSAPRELLARRAAAAGLDVMNTVSGRTHLLMCNRPDLDTNKAAKAREHGTPVITEAEFTALLGSVTPGQPKLVDAPQATGADPVVPAPRATAPSGLLSGRRVVVLGGSHGGAAEIRARLLEAGASVAVNLTGSVTDVVLAPSAELDGRLDRARALGIQPLDPATLAPRPWPDGVDTADLPESSGAPPAAAADATTAIADQRILVRGEVMQLPAKDEWLVEVRWAAPGRHAAEQYDVDVVALVVDDDEQVAVDEDFVFYNAPEHPSGAVLLSSGIAGEALVSIRPEDLPAARQRVLLAAAIDGAVTFGDVGAVELILRDADGAPVARATLDAATQERSLILGTLYRRNGAWRWRAVGQGYQDDLADLAIRHGVDIDEAG